MNYISNITRSQGDPKVLHIRAEFAWHRRPAGARRSAGSALGWALPNCSRRGGSPALWAWRARKGSCAPMARARSAAACCRCRSEKQTGLWSRVAGDGLDIATLMSAWRDDNPKKENVSMAIMMVAGITLLDIIGAQGTTARHVSRGERRSYRDRSGFPQGLQAAKGAARQVTEAAETRLTTTERSGTSESPAMSPAA